WAGKCGLAVPGREPHPARIRLATLSGFCRDFALGVDGPHTATALLRSVRGEEHYSPPADLRSVPEAGTGREKEPAMEKTTSHTTLTPQQARPGEAMSVRRMFTRPGVHPFETVEWELRTAAVGSFRQDDVEFPTTWSQNATNIVAQKYFRGQLTSPTRERSVKTMVARVAGTIAD